MMAEVTQMNSVKRYRTIYILVLLLAGILITACGPSAEKLNKEGNMAFGEEAFVEALAAYEAAQVENPELAEPYYNAANALYREGAYAEAVTMMQEALKYTNAAPLELQSFYNQGNASFNLEEWQAAVDAYTEALLRNPDDAEAKYNLELALQQLQQQQEQQQQEQDQQQEENQDQEQDQSQDGQDQEDQQNQSQSDQQQEQDQQDQQDQSDEQSSEGESGSEQEQEQNQNQQDGQPQNGEESEQQENQNQIPQPGQRMTAEQARQLLAAIAQDAETLQERLGQIFVAPPNQSAQQW